jgi:hypothetical protein
VPNSVEDRQRPHPYPVTPHTRTEHRCSRGTTRPLNPAGLFASMAPTRQKKRSNLSVLEPRAPPPSSSAPLAPSHPHLPPASSGRGRRDPAGEVSPRRSNPQRNRGQGREWRGRRRRRKWTRGEQRHPLGYMRAVQARGWVPVQETRRSPIFGWTVLPLQSQPSCSGGRVAVAGEREG